MPMATFTVTPNTKYVFVWQSAYLSLIRPQRPRGVCTGNVQRGRAVGGVARDRQPERRLQVVQQGRQHRRGQRPRSMCGGRRARGPRLVPRQPPSGPHHRAQAALPRDDLRPPIRLQLLRVARTVTPRPKCGARPAT